MLEEGAAVGSVAESPEPRGHGGQGPGPGPVGEANQVATALRKRPGKGLANFLAERLEAWVHEKLPRAPGGERRANIRRRYKINNKTTTKVKWLQVLVIKRKAFATT